MWPAAVDGWGHLVGVIDCYDRELMGWEFALRGRAKEAERAIEEACIRRFGTATNRQVASHQKRQRMIFQSRRFRAACRDYRLSQEFITPYTPQQNGIIERFFRSLKEECAWQFNFGNFLEAKKAIAQSTQWYNAGKTASVFRLQEPQESIVRKNSERWLEIWGEHYSPPPLRGPVDIQHQPRVAVYPLGIR